MIKNTKEYENYGKIIADIVNKYEKKHPEFMLDMITSYGKCKRLLLPPIVDIEDAYKDSFKIAKEYLFGPAQYYDRSNERVVKAQEYFNKGFSDNINNKDFKTAILFLERPWELTTTVILDVYTFVI